MEAYGLVGDDAPKIIKALVNPKYTWRHVEGIAKESGCSKEKVKETLDWLYANDLARKSTRTWALTAKGRQAFSGYSE